MRLLGTLFEPLFSVLSGIVTEVKFLSYVVILVLIFEERIMCTLIRCAYLTPLPPADLLYHVAVGSVFREVDPMIS